MEILRHLALSGPVGWEAAFTALLLAFGLGQAVAMSYMWSFRGLSYSRTFVQGIALGPIVTCMLLLAIGDSIAAGIGLAGGLSIIRFRTTMRDPRDMVFVFAGLGVGIVCGLRAFPAALAGTAVFLAAVVLLDLVAFGTRHTYDAVVRFVSPTDRSEEAGRVVAQHAPQHVLVTLRQGGSGRDVEHAYQVHLPDPGARTALVTALQEVGGVREVRLYLQTPTQEL